MSIATSAIPTPYNHASLKRRKNTWYSIANGNWTDPNVWMSNALAYGQWNFTYPGQAIPSPTFPQVGDDVYINHTVTLNVGNASVPMVVNNLYVSGTFKADNSSRVINVNGDIQAVGTVDFTSSNVNLQLFGVNNYIVNFTSGTTSTVTYARSGDQTVLDLAYCKLFIINSGVKTPTNKLTTSSDLVVADNGTLELLSYDLEVGGITYVGYAAKAGGTFKKSNTGYMLLKGQFRSGQGGASIIDLSGNPTVELRGGTYFAGYGITFNAGTGTWNFTTNNQSTTFGNGITWDFNNVTISGAITVTNLNSNGQFQISGSINGTVAGSTLVNQGNLWLNTFTAPMITGVFTYSSSTNTIGYVMNGDFTIPYTNYQGLVVNGTGIKTLTGDTTINQAFSLLCSGSVDGIEFGTNNVYIYGQTNLRNGYFSKNGAGNVLFGGVLTILYGAINFTFSGNPTVELRGGTYFVATPAEFGSGQWKFTTNNQDFNCGGNTQAIVNASILISGAITVNILAGSISSIQFNKSITGDNAASTLTLQGVGSIGYADSLAPMTVGLLYGNQASNSVTFSYNRDGDQDVQAPSDPTNPGYVNLTLNGSGVKTLLGNVSVKGTYTLTSPATLDTNGFALTNP